MITSRKLEDLHPIVKAKAEAMIAECEAQGVDLLVTCTLRDHEAQNALYAQGRTAKGLIVTNARGGDSFHNYGVALDVVPMRNGKPVWGTSGIDGDLWNKVGAIGECCGLEWSGRWTGKLRELAHFQFLGGHDLAYFKKGGTL